MPSSPLAKRRARWVPDGMSFPGDAVELQRVDLGWMLECVTGLWNQPSVRGEDSIAPEVRGVWPRPYIAHIRPVELAGPVQGVMDEEDDDPEATRRASFRTLMDELLDTFSVERRGTLYVDEDDGTVRWIHLRPLNLVDGLEDIPAVRQSISIALESDEDPYWSSSDAETFGPITWHDLGEVTDTRTADADVAAGDMVLDDDMAVWEASNDGHTDPGAIVWGGTTVMDGDVLWSLLIPWQPFTFHSGHYQPTIPNQHAYNTDTPGTSGPTEPEPWPIAGETFPDPEP